MKKRYTEEQIVRILQEVEAGRTVREVCREYNVAEPTYYRWKKIYGGMELSDIKEHKRLKAENAKLKKLVANQALKILCYEELAKKKW